MFFRTNKLFQKFCSKRQIYTIETYLMFFFNGNEFTNSYLNQYIKIPVNIKIIINSVVKNPNNSFEILGRFNKFDIRGCNLMVI